jgi:DNA polymerase III epsilon subunit-like protein
MIIVMDTETTALLAVSAAAQEEQPHLIEFAAIKFNTNLEPIQNIHIVMNPRVKIPDESIRIHGFTNEMVKDKQPFVAHWKQIASFFHESTILVGHNVLFDKNVLIWELTRINKQYNFPWCLRDIDTVEECTKWLGHRLSLTDLHIKLFGEPFQGAHGAMEDTKATAHCFRKMVNDGVIKL